MKRDRHSRLRPYGRQSGAALIALVVVVMSVVITMSVTGLMRDNPRLEAEIRASTRLGEARAAVIAQATAEWCRHTFGGAVESIEDNLPCPADPATAPPGAVGVATCTTPSTSDLTGLLPWHTLGLPPLADASGECLWYRRHPGGNVAAILIAPGEADSSQSRDRGELCSDGANFDFLDPIFLSSDPTLAQLSDPANTAQAFLAITAASLQIPANCDPPPTDPASCATNAQILLDHISGSNNTCRAGAPPQIDPACTAAQSAIASESCSCSPSAQAFMSPPCINGLNPPQCGTAVAALNACANP